MTPRPANIEHEAQAWRDGTWAVFRIVELPRDEPVGGASLRLGEHGIGEASYSSRREPVGAGWRHVPSGCFPAGPSMTSASLASSCACTRTTWRRRGSPSAPGFQREGVERPSRAWPDGRASTPSSIPARPASRARSRARGLRSVRLGGGGAPARAARRDPRHVRCRRRALPERDVVRVGRRPLPVRHGATTRKVANVERDARGSVLVHDSRVGFDVVGLRASGRMRVVRGSEGAAFGAARPRALSDRRRVGDPERSRLPRGERRGAEFVPGARRSGTSARQEANRELLDVGTYRPLAPTTPR